MTKTDTSRLILSFIHRTIMHHITWFMEVQKQLGPEKAYKVLDEAWKNSYPLQLNRLAKNLGFEMTGELPSPLLEMPENKLLNLRDNLAVNWLANDGIWFQAVENAENMALAKTCNDNAWEKFSPFEAWEIKKLLGLGEEPGLDGLKQALGLRLYAFINKQTFTEETENSFIFRMNDCRVQSARKRKGLADYPCKSAGIIEYSEFAKAIDSRIQTTCICCPPDEHPDEYYCAWKFSI